MVGEFGVASRTLKWCTLDARKFQRRTLDWRDGVWKWSGAGGLNVLWKVGFVSMVSSGTELQKAESLTPAPKGL